MMAGMLALAACGDEDRTQTEYTPSNDKASTSADDSAARPARAVPVPDTMPVKSPPQDTLPITLAPLGRATARGTGQVAATGKSASITVALSSTAPGQTYEGAVRQGICASMGASVASLYPVSADSTGSGQASSPLNVPVDSLTGKPHVVVYGRGGRPEACAAIPSSAPPPPISVSAPSPAPAPLPAPSRPDTVRG